jgi:pimeloyl-ACP methyl ester carboxylesterase
MTGPRPVMTMLHGYGGFKLRPYTWDPHPTWCDVYRLYPLDVADTWWFGNARDHDYREGLEVGADDTIVNFTEQRVLRMLLDLERHPVHGPNVDMNRLYVAGHSMGGSGALALALRYPNVFAAAHASQPMTDYQLAGQAGGFDWQPQFAVNFGTQALQLPIDLDAPEGLADHLLEHNGTSIWDWQNHRATLQTRRHEERAPFGIDHSVTDPLMEFETQGEPIYQALDEASICWAGEVQNAGHVPSNQSTLPASLAKVLGGGPFWGFTGKRDETVPGFGQASGNPPLPPSGTGMFNNSLEWSSSWNAWDGAPVDQTDEWRMSLRNTSGIPRIVSVTPRRLQNFAPQPGWAYWASTVDAQTDEQLSSSMVTVDADGLLTVADVDVRPGGTQVRIRPSLTGSPSEISVATGGLHELDVRLGDDLGGHVFLVLGSVSGTTPGIPLGDWQLSLNPDLYFQLLVTTPGGAPLSRNVGLLSPGGETAVTFGVPLGLDPSYAGFVFQHAVAILNPLDLGLSAITNPVAFALVP